MSILFLSQKKSLAILPNGDEKIYLVESEVIEISSSDETVDVFATKNTDNINLNNFSISLYICALLIMVFMIFDDFFSIKPIIRLYSNSS